MTIEIKENRNYKTRCGMQAQVISVEKNGSETILKGFIENRVPVEWNSEGALKTHLNGRNRYDLVKFWGAWDTRRRIHEPFRPNGCSFFPKGDWDRICLWHDLGYWWGGSKSERKLVDKEFRYDLEKNHSKILAFVMYWAVRAGGIPWLPTPWHWGSGMEKGVYSYNEQKKLLEKLK